MGQTIAEWFSREGYQYHWSWANTQHETKTKNQKVKAQRQFFLSYVQWDIVIHQLILWECKLPASFTVHSVIAEAVDANVKWGKWMLTDTSLNLYFRIHIGRVADACFRLLNKDAEASSTSRARCFSLKISYFPTCHQQLVWSHASSQCTHY